jgi:hypothetical protein
MEEETKEKGDKGDKGDRRHGPGDKGNGRREEWKMEERKKGGMEERYVNSGSGTVLG